MKWFVSAVAQHDNLGDVEIRRQMIAWLGESGTVHAFCRGVQPEFLKALRLPASARLYTDKRTFTRALLQPAGNGGRCLVLAPGEYPLALSATHLRGAAMNLGTIAALKILGGDSAIVGRSYAGESRLMTPLLSGIHGLSHTWLRDREAATRWGTRYMPDIALYAAQRTGAKQGMIAFTFRSDQGAGIRSIPLLQALRRERGYELRGVTQVRRDQGCVDELVNVLEASSSRWTGENLEEERDRVMTTYSGSNLVVSDRFHALVFGMLNGAVPIAICTEGRPKLRRHFSSLGLEDLCIEPEDLDGAMRISRAEAEWRNRITATLRTSRGQLRAIKSDLRTAVGDG